MADVIDRYLEAYDAMKAAEAAHQSAKEVKAAAEMELVAHLSSLGLDTAGRGNRSVSVNHRTYGKVIDFRALRLWVLKQDEPISEYMEEVLKKKELNRIAREAQAKAAETGVPVEELLPDGAGVYITTVVTVRKRAVKMSVKPKTALERLDDIMEDF